MIIVEQKLIKFYYNLICTEIKILNIYYILRMSAINYKIYTPTLISRKAGYVTV